MSWNGDLVFGQSWAIFRGEAADNTPHAHAAIQIVFAHVGLATIIASDGSEKEGTALAIRPLVEHSLAADGAVTLLYIEPQSPLAFFVADLAGDAEIAEVDASALDFDVARPVADWTLRLAELAAASDAALDPRLEQALTLLAREPGAVGIAQAAFASDLSESRLRTLARQTLGLPLSTWLIWRKLDCAARALRAGDALADAAIAGGFADQAHLARAMRRMFGITPRTAKRATAESRSIQE